MKVIVFGPLSGRWYTSWHAVSSIRRERPLMIITCKNYVGENTDHAILKNAHAYALLAGVSDPVSHFKDVTSYKTVEIKIVSRN